MELSRLSQVLGGERVLHKRLRSMMDLIELGHAGIPKSALVHLASYLSWPLAQIASVLPISERTIQRYADDDRFSPVVSEQILQLALVIARGSEVFEDKERFLLWMMSPSSALADKKPVELLTSRFGTEMVLNEIGRIEYGVFS